MISACGFLSLQICENGEGAEEEEVEKEAREILDEMGHSMFLPAVRFLALLLRPFVRSALQGIFVNRGGLQAVSGSVEKRRECECSLRARLPPNTRARVVQDAR